MGRGEGDIQALLAPPVVAGRAADPAIREFEQQRSVAALDRLLSHRRRGQISDSEILELIERAVASEATEEIQVLLQSSQTVDPNPVLADPVSGQLPERLLDVLQESELQSMRDQNLISAISSAERSSEAVVSNSQLKDPPCLLQLALAARELRRAPSLSWRFSPVSLQILTDELAPGSSPERSLRLGWLSMWTEREKRRFHKPLTQLARVFDLSPACENEITDRVFATAAIGLIDKMPKVFAGEDSNPTIELRRKLRQQIVALCAAEIRMDEAYLSGEWISDFPSAGSEQLPRLSQRLQTAERLGELSQWLGLESASELRGSDALRRHLSELDVVQAVAKAGFDAAARGGEDVRVACTSELCRSFPPA